MKEKDWKNRKKIEKDQMNMNKNKKKKKIKN